MSGIWGLRLARPFFVLLASAISPHYGVTAVWPGTIAPPTTASLLAHCLMKDAGHGLCVVVIFKPRAFGLR